MGLEGKTSNRKHLAQSFSFSSIVSTKPALTNHHFHCIWFHILNIQNLAQLHIEKNMVKTYFKLYIIHSFSLPFGVLICT